MGLQDGASFHRIINNLKIKDMRIDFNKKVMDWEGKETEASLASVLGRNIYYLSDNPNLQLPYEDKYKAYQIGRRILDSDGKGDMEISTEEATLIKRMASVLLTIGGYGQVVDLIEGN